MARHKQFGDLGGDLQPFTGQGLSGLVRRPEQTEIVSGSDTELSTDESMELERCETIIERGLKTFVEVGVALERVRDLRLYRVEYTTFEAYCDERWGLKRQRAYELMKAATIVQHLSEISDIPAPERESHAAALATLAEPDQQREAWERVVQLAEGARITARLVEQVVDELLAAQAPPAAPAPRSLPAGGTAPGAQDTPSSPIIDLEALPDEEVAPAPPDDVAGLRAALAQVQTEREAERQRVRAALDILHEYQEHITRAQKYKPTSERGEAVSPLLRAIERVYTLLREGQAGRE